MLPLVIIEQIKKREEEQRRRQQQPFVQVPVSPPVAPRRPATEDDDPERGSVIIEVG